MPKRGENIRKRKDKRWEGRYIKGRDEYGKAQYASVYGKTYSEVKQKLILAHSEKKNIKILNLAQQQKLEKYLVTNMNPTKLGIYLSLYTGLRIGEVCALTWRNIDLKEQVIHIESTVTRIKCENNINKTKLIIDKPKTKASIRDIPIPIFICQKILEIKKKSFSEFVISEKSEFVNPRTYEYRFHKILNECNIPKINYHALRHTFATRSVEANADIKLLSEILGHVSVAITMDIYVHPSNENKRNQIEKIVNLTA